MFFSATLSVDAWCPNLGFHLIFIDKALFQLFAKPLFHEQLKYCYIPLLVRVSAVLVQYHLCNFYNLHKYYTFYT